MKRLFLGLSILLLTSCGEEPISVPTDAGVVDSQDRPPRRGPYPINTTISTVYTIHDGGVLTRQPRYDAGPPTPGTEDSGVVTDSGVQDGGTEDSGLVEECEEDRDRGHGNDCDRLDSDNPGLKHKKVKKKK